MKYLIMALCVLSAGCQFPATLTTECRHIVKAQYAAAIEQYPKGEVEIVTLQDGDNFHQQLRVWFRTELKWKYLKNSHMRYSFWDDPEEGYEIINIE